MSEPMKPVPPASEPMAHLTPGDFSIVDAARAEQAARMADAKRRWAELRKASTRRPAKR